MRKTDLFEYTIGQNFLPYLIDANTEGLTTAKLEEIRAFEEGAFANAAISGAISAHWTELTECASWRKCEVSGYYGECSDIGLILIFPESA